MTFLYACSYIEEVLGHPAMASMGRMRRRMAVCSLLQLIGAQLCPVLLELKHIAQIMTVAMRAMQETPHFEVRAVPTPDRADTPAEILLDASLSSQSPKRP